MTTVYIIRHAESLGNSEGKLCGHYNIGLSKAGEKQLTCLAERFRYYHLDAIYTSPLYRAVKTAEALDLYGGPGITPDSELIELYCGDLDGKTWTQIRTDYPKHYRQWVEEPHNFVPQNGESMRHLYDRIWSAVSRIALKNDGKTIAITTHGGAIRCMLCRLLERPITDLADMPIVENTAVTKLVLDDGKFTLVEGPEANHLPAELCTVAKMKEYSKKGC